MIISTVDVDRGAISQANNGGNTFFIANSISPKPVINDIENNPNDEIMAVEAIGSNDEGNTDPDVTSKNLLEPSAKAFSELCRWNMIYLMITVIKCVLWSFPTTVIPMINQIEFPDYWWEWMVNGTSLCVALNVAMFAWIDICLVFNFKPFSILSRFIRIFMIDLLTQFLLVIICHLIWTIWLDYNHPMPMIGIILFLGGHAVHFTLIWFNFPGGLKSTTQGRQKVRAYILYRLWYLFYTQQQVIMNIIMEMMPLSFQWIMAFIIPVVRESNLWVMIKLLERTASQTSDLPPLIQRLTPTICTSLTYGFWVAQVVSSAASTTTGYCLLGVDFMLNVYNTYNITKLHRKISSTQEQDRWLSVISKKQKLAMKEEALMLAGSEIVEFLVPIIYCITFLMALFGSNSDKIGGIGFSEWQYSKLEDLSAFLTDLGMMFTIDIAAWITSATLLWKYSSINLLDESYKLMKLYWPLMSTAIGGAISFVSNQTHLKCNENETC